MATTTKRSRKPLTPEQHAAYEQRREQVRAVSKKIAAMTEDERLDLGMQVGTIVTCEQRRLSVYNVCMLVMQRPDATIVGGFQQWKRVGRKVKKGEHGSYIWVPLGERGTNDQGLTSTQMPDEKRFLMVAVFDVSQTEEITSNTETEDGESQ